MVTVYILVEMKPRYKTPLGEKWNLDKTHHWGKMEPTCIYNTPLRETMEHRLYTLREKIESRYNTPLREKMDPGAVE
jgi:hypothetical protein